MLSFYDLSKDVLLLRLNIRLEVLAGTIRKGKAKDTHFEKEEENSICRWHNLLYRKS